ncbi:hypothetical protein R3P38DRAFT_3108756 [Favolaschia claudopus]|uniref:Uncharacterized protein n=1 Tax=Favolaschia claudopus TaxID=2862362 RepID=A0AAV9ZIN5_9AGAR
MPSLRLLFSGYLLPNSRGNLSSHLARAMFAWLFSLFSPRQPTISPPSTRTVPCSGIDIIASEIILTTGLIVNAQLNPKILEESLCKSIETKLPRAGARLAKKNGSYEFRIPDAFDAATPTAGFTVAHHPEVYNCSGRPEIPLGMKNSKPCVVPRPGAELSPNTPLVHVHVAVFQDLTLIGVTAPHIGFDAVGTGTLLNAWARVVNGEDLDSIPAMPWDAQPFSSMAPTVAPSTKRGWFDLGWFKKFWFILGFIRVVIRDPQEIQHLVRMPKTFLEEEKRKAMDELKAEGSSEYVGSSDVLAAWWYKIIYGIRAPADPTPIHIHIVNNLRNHPIFGSSPSPPLAPLSYPFLNNAVMTIPVPPLPVNTIQTQPLRSIALHLRRAILLYNADPAAIRTDVEWHGYAPNRGKTVYPCPPGSEFFVQSSWRVAGYGALDFSGAVVEKFSGAVVEKFSGAVVEKFSGAVVENDTSAAKPRVVFLHWFGSSKNTIPYRNSAVVGMEDDEVIWVGYVCGKKEWEKIRQRGELEFV